MPKKHRGPYPSEFRRRLINRFAKESIQSPFQQRRVHVTIKGGAEGEAVATALPLGLKPTAVGP